MGHWTKIFAVLMLGMLSACGVRTITSDVTRFHLMPPMAGGSIAIVAKDEHKAGSIEFARYVDFVWRGLSRFGYQRAGEGPPDYIVLVDYFQRPVAIPDDGERGRMSVGVGGGSSGHTSVGVGIGTSFDMGGGRRHVAARTFILELESRETGKRLFEGRVKSQGPAENFAEVMPYMIDALFQEFPGNSGETVTVEVKVE